MRPPSLSERQISGRPLRPAHSAIRFCLRMLTGAVVPASTVASMAMIAHPAAVDAREPGDDRRRRRRAPRGAARARPACPARTRSPASISCVDALARGLAPGGVVAGDALRRRPSPGRPRAGAPAPRRARPCRAAAGSGSGGSGPSARRSSPLERRRALLDEGRDALGVVLAALQHRHRVDRVRVALPGVPAEERLPRPAPAATARAIMPGQALGLGEVLALGRRRR